MQAWLMKMHAGICLVMLDRATAAPEGVAPG